VTTRVFLSHSSAHAELARRLARDLGASNIAVTLDQWEGGGGLPSVQSVPRAISDEAFVLPLLTPSEATRSWIGKTWQAAIFDEAVRRDIQVLPVRGEICEEVPEFLRDMSFADLRNRGYELELRRLVETIRERSGDQAITLPAVADDISQSLATDTREPLVIEVGQALARGARPRHKPARIRRHHRLDRARRPLLRAWRSVPGTAHARVAERSGVVRANPHQRVRGGADRCAAGVAARQ
jgi:hypothetical protein